MRVTGPGIERSIDANYIFDLETAGILHYPLHLGYSFRVTDLIAHEIKTIPHTRLRLSGVQIVELEPEQVLALYDLRQLHIRLSYMDLSAFVLARDSGAVLITGDGLLRSLAKAHGVECHGTLWILDALVDAGILNPRDTADALRTMRRNNRWLPKQECDRRLKIWDP
ncbi:DUF3368 domain-containing protein [Methanoculleus sp. FWC-SCC1]|uniref:DUF3368 domain-containing protein n=1 Tax=Methanoculleus frigidifontis TaxID=2584085 RepID=A0ABT8M6R2_9EURY|nr:hypothetical protein [Methanoculleus sp. FWC-SCC1]MDN7023620.1 DUF3368 domain-containing protein [Methanoculleus sp. FWC-SCC1]